MREGEDWDWDYGGDHRRAKASWHRSLLLFTDRGGGGEMKQMVATAKAPANDNNRAAPPAEGATEE